jgi:hypothetical protein
MKKVFHSNKTFSNIPIKEAGVEPEVIDVTNAQYNKIFDHKLNAEVVNGKLTFSPIPEPEKTPEELQKEALKEKINNGTATQSDLVEAIKLIL